MALKTRKKNHSTASVIAIVIMIGVWALWSFYPRQSANIFEVNSGVPQGQGTYAGSIFKDSPVGEPGKYFLVTNEGMTIILDALDLDDSLDMPVTITGEVVMNDVGMPFMIIDTIEKQ